MIETVVTVGLQVDERIIIKKNRLVPIEDKPDMKRICIVTGIHGDELDGQYICYQIIKRINENLEKLNGIIDIYPALNPLGIDCVTRGIPMFDLDMNRIFPGDESGAMAEHIAGKIIQDIKGADICIDLHSSNIFLKEIPQVRISEENAETLLPYAKMLNTDFVWIHSSLSVQDATLTYSLNSIGVPTLAVEMGVGMRINKEYCNQLVEGIFVLLKQIGIWSGDISETKEPIISIDGQMALVTAEEAGVFIPSVDHCKKINKGEHIGDIINPLLGSIEEQIYAPCDGIIFTLREYPVVYNGSLLARILGGEQ